MLWTDRWGKWRRGIPKLKKPGDGIEICYDSIGLHFTMQMHRTALFLFSFLPSTEAPVWYDLAIFLGMIWVGGSFLYNINLRATHTTTLSIRGVTISIYLVSSTTDSIRLHVVLFKTVTILTSDLKSEFLCQSSFSCTEPTDPLNTSYAWDISHALVTTYNPHYHNPSALTEYLKQKLCHQWAKRLGRSPSAQVELDVPLKRNKINR